MAATADGPDVRQDSVRLVVVDCASSRCDTLRAQCTLARWRLTREMVAGEQLLQQAIGALRHCSCSDRARGILKEEL